MVKQKLMNINWGDCYRTRDVDSCYDSFIAILTEVINTSSVYNHGSGN